MQLTDPSRLQPVHPNDCGAAGMQERSHLGLERRTGHQSLDEAFYLEEAGPELGDVPLGRTHSPGEDRTNPSLLPDTHEPRRLLAIVELAGHAESQSGLPQLLGRGLWGEDVAYFEQPPAGRPEGPVAGHRVEQTE